MLIYWHSWIRSLRSQIHSFKCYSGNGKKLAPVETGAVTKKLTVYVSVLKNSFKIKNTFYKTEIFKIYCFTPKKAISLLSLASRHCVTVASVASPFFVHSLRSFSFSGSLFRSLLSISTTLRSFRQNAFKLNHIR